MRKIGFWTLKGIAWILVLSMVAWTFGALHFDFPVDRELVSWVYVIAMAAVLGLVRPMLKKLLVVAIVNAVVLAWWLKLKPSNDRPWMENNAKTAWAVVDGETVTLHNMRNFDYKAGKNNPEPRWESRTVNLSSLTGVDIFINQWGSPIMAHPILSFQFYDAPPVCFSIETRREMGEGYSAVGGIYRQFELIYIVADERDVIRLRTNSNGGETTHLYRTSLSAATARDRFMDYVHAINGLKEHPRWYNAITTNCTTSIHAQHPAEEREHWDWRMLLNGSLDEMLFERSVLRTDGLTFAELKKRALINTAAQSADARIDFSERIRDGRAGFGRPSEETDPPTKETNNQKP